MKRNEFIWRCLVSLIEFNHHATFFCFFCQGGMGDSFLIGGES